MEFLKDISVTSINCPTVIRSKKGDSFQMINRECHGLSFCINGQITYTMNGKNFVSVPNSAIYLPKGANYCLSRDKDGLFPLVNFDCNNCDLNEIAIIKRENPSLWLKNCELLHNLF